MVSSATDLMVQHSRRQLWVALFLVLVLGAAALLLLAFPGARSGHTLMYLYPDFIAIGLVSIYRSKRQLKGVTVSNVQAVVDDELRRHSLGMAWRNGFLLMLLAQPLFALLVTWSGTPYPVALMAAASALAGVTVALASVLYYDR